MLRTPMPDPTNAPELTVSELSGAIKRTLESAFARIRVRGEVTEAKTYPSGHTYFSLKDEGGKIRAVIWKFAASKAGLKPENGTEVIATGKISAYGDRSEYQLVVERLEYAGEGALLARIDMLKKRLGAEGLFDPDRKQPIPLLPTIIGVITSPKGAVLHDIQTTIARRFARPILLYPVPVQGEGAAEKIAAAIAAMDTLPRDGIPRPDVLIVARGGGSLEDLMAFNEEVVLRAAAACRMPLISAVGHETDTTLIDFVSDRRAPTPTAAAEMAVPPRTELLADLAQKAARLLGGLARLTGERRLRFQAAANGLPDLPSLLGNARMRLDDRAGRLGLALPNLLAGRRAALVGVERHIPDPLALIANRRAGLVAVERRLPDPSALIGQRRAALAVLADRHRTGLLHTLRHAGMQAARTTSRLTAAPLNAALRERRARLEGLAARLDGASYEAVLARGFVLVRDAAGLALSSASAVKPGARVALRFADGEVAATADRPARQATLNL
jgi:exodeoxyribonuclease VII large subunit